MPRAKKDLTEEQPEIQQEAAPASQDEQEMLSASQDEREEIFINRALDGDTGPYFASVNGVNYLLPRGKTSKVPRAVAEEIRRSWAAQDAWDDRAEALAANAQA